MKYILVNYNFDPSWVLDYTDDYLIYDRSEDFNYWTRNVDTSKVIRTQNIGNVDFDRLTYLIDNYDRLPEVFLLAKSNLFKFITEEEFQKVKDNTDFTPLLTQNHKVYEPICRYNNGIYEEINNSWYVPSMIHKFETYNEWARYLNLPQPEYLQFAPGGNYILTRERVQRYPLESYIKMRKTLRYTQLPAEAHFVERSYYTLWK